MRFNDAAVLVLFIFFGGLLAMALAVAVGLVIGIVADARRGLTTELMAHSDLRKNWERYADRKITGK